MLTSSKCVLLLSDEGLNIYDVGSSKTAFVDSVPWDTQDFEEAVASAIRRKSRGKTVTLLNDMVEQHYRKERIPKINMMDRGGIIDRRLGAAFPSYPIRSALKLKEKSIATSRDAVSTDIYLLAAVPLSENIRRTLSAVKRAHSTIAGFSLLPVESSSMVHTLGKKLNKGGDQSMWTVFVGQHQSGGLRQIVTRNGELALTRMTPIVDSDADVETWSSEVVSEIKGTMSYLSRFGFDQNDGLDVIIISNNSTADLLISKVDFDCNLNVLTSVEAANYLGLRLGLQKEQRYADPIHIAWLGKKKALTLPLKSPLINQITQPVRMALAASLVLLLVCGELGYRTYNSFTDWNKSRSEISQAESALSTTRAEHTKEIEAKSQMGENYALIEKATKVYNSVDSVAMKPLAILKTIAKSLGPDLHLQSMKINAAPPKPVIIPTPEELAAQEAEGKPIAEPKQEFNIVLRIVLPAELNPETGVRLINSFSDRLQKYLPDHKVSIVKQVADLSYTGNYVGQAGETTADGKVKEDYEAQILITGALL